MAATYWIAPSGSNSNPCSETQPCASIQYGVSKLYAGDTLNIKSGIYKETNTDSVTFFDIPVAINVPRSGTQASPIVIQAAPGDEGSVTIDLQATYLGFHLGGHQNYIHIKNINIRNARSTAINVPDAGDSTSYNETAKWSIGLLIEGNTITDTYGSGPGRNTAAVRIYHVRDSIIRNNTIDRVGTTDLINELSHNGCILSYGLWNITVENNLLSRCGAEAIAWKKQALDLPETGYQSIIRFNKFTDNYRTVWSGSGRGNTTAKMLISNNIFENYYLGIDCDGRGNVGCDLTVSHNFFNATGPNSYHAEAIVVRDDLTSLKGAIFGNIYHRNEANVYDFRYKYQGFNQVDYNIFTSEPKNWLYGYDSEALSTSTLGQWQALVNLPPLPNNPDSNSVISSISSMAINLSSQDYKLPAVSVGINFMPNGDNIGPYQTGDEVIGPRSSDNLVRLASPNSPANLSISIAN